MGAYQYLSRREIVIQSQLNYCLGMYYTVASPCATTSPLNSWLKRKLLSRIDRVWVTVALFFKCTYRMTLQNPGFG